MSTVVNGQTEGAVAPTDTSRDIMPPMPWQMYRNLTDDDLKAVYAYLRTIPPVTNHIPDPVAPPAPPKK